jgi:hypothetical protein
MDMEARDGSETHYEISVLADMLKEEKILKQILPYRKSELQYFFAVIQKQVTYTLPLRLSRSKNRLQLRRTSF